MKVLYNKPEIVDQLTVCSRRLKGKKSVNLVQPLIAKDFDEYMGGIDLGYLPFVRLKNVNEER